MDRWQDVTSAARVALLRGQLRWQYRRHPMDYTDADPFKIIAFCPDAVTQQQRYVAADPRVTPSPRNGFDMWRCIGYVVAGTWDTATIALSERPIYQAIRSHFADGIPWLETDFLRGVVAGRYQWHGCRTEQDILERGRRLDALYEAIQREGYRSQTMLRGRLPWREAMDEITLNIGRNGELIRNNAGMHRLVIAQVLGVARVPARVLIRHRDWQRLRNAARQTGVIPAEYRDHPDMQDLLPS